LNLSLAVIGRHLGVFKKTVAKGLAIGDQAADGVSAR
jgi:hypothetical protein